ncbi:MAG: hypothetical protein AMXMBFR82_19160 [Candidatus Hydrogenedentota bacterium]
MSLIILVVQVCLGTAGQAEVLSPEVLPTPILRISGVELVTAGAAAEWHSQGIRGAVLHRPLAEVEAAASILHEAGITRNFLRVDALGIGVLQTASTAAQSMKLVGLVIDLSQIYDVAIGTPHSHESQNAVSDLRTRGRSIVEAVQSEHPAGTLVFQLPGRDRDDGRVAELLAGVCDGAAEPSLLHLALPCRNGSDDARSRAARIQRLVRQFRQAAGGDSRGFDSGVQIALPNSPVSSATLLSGILSADSYVFVGPQVLAQRGQEGAMGDAPAKAGLAAMLEHLDGLERAGGIQVAATHAQILRGADGAAIVFPSGIPKPIPLEVHTPEATVINLRTHQSTEVHAENGKVELATSSDPIMVKGLPVRAWAVPAGFSMDADTAAVSPAGSIPVRFGWANRTGLSFTGTLETVCPDRFALLPRTQVVDVGPGETLAAVGRLQGRANPGETVPVKLVLTSPGGPPVERTFPVTIPPHLLWQVPVRISGDSGLTLADVNGNSTAALICASAGEVSAWGGSGEFLWRSTVTGSGSKRVAGGRLASGQPYIAFPAASGVVILDAMGSALWQASLPGGARTVRTGNLHIAPGEEVVAGSDKGVVSAFLSNGSPMWSKLTDAPVRDVEVEDLDNDGRDECLALADGLLALDGAGNELWHVLEGSGDSACPMLIADLNGDWQWNVVVGLVNGTVAVVDAAAGSVLHEKAVASEPAIGVACGELLENPGQEILIATDERLYCLSAALETLWEIPLELSGTPAVSGAGTGARILAPTRHGALVCLNGSGTERWRDERAAAAITGTPLVVAASTGDQEVCIFGSEDGFLRAIILPE